MATRYIYYVWWSGGVVPLSKNIATAMRRIRRADPDAPPLTEQGFADELGRPVRWRSPILGADDIFCILRESNCDVSVVKRWQCKCNDVDACDRGDTRCPDDEGRARLRWGWKRLASDYACVEPEVERIRRRQPPRTNLARTSRARKR